MEEAGQHPVHPVQQAVPFRDDATAMSWHHFADVPDRRARLEVFAEAYGLTETAGLVEGVIDRQRLTIVHVEALAARGLEPQVTWLSDGTLDDSRHLVAWAEENRHLFT